MEVQIKDITAARRIAKKTSAEHPELYFTFYACFGLFLKSDKRLHKFAPTDTPDGLRFYYKAGKEKTFTDAQVIADQLATPVSR